MKFDRRWLQQRGRYGLLDGEKFVAEFFLAVVRHVPEGTC